MKFLLLVVFEVCCFSTPSCFLSLSRMVMCLCLVIIFRGAGAVFTGRDNVLGFERATSVLCFSVSLSVRGFFCVLISLLLDSAVTFQAR